MDCMKLLLMLFYQPCNSKELTGAVYVPLAVPEEDEDLLETGQHRLVISRAGCKH